MPRTRRRNARQPKDVETIRHVDATRPNIPSAEHQSLMDEDEQSPIRVAYERRNRDLDPQLVWRGKDEQDASDLVVQAPPLYIQERVHPKALIDDLMRQSQENRDADAEGDQGGFADLFSDFNGLPSEEAKTEFYQHDANWSNRMIFGDSLQVMSSLAEKEGVRGKVQCIYIDPPYGIRFNSNFQWSTTSTAVRDGNLNQITREPEQIKAFRDTWRYGVHSYLSHLRDRITVARDLLSDSGSMFIQIGDENVHRVRSLMDEVFGDSNFVSEILYRRGGFQTSDLIANTFDYVLWYAKSITQIKTRTLHSKIEPDEWYANGDHWIEFTDGSRVVRRPGDAIPKDGKLHSDRACFSATGGDTSSFTVKIFGTDVSPPAGRGWSTSLQGVNRLIKANRLMIKGRRPRFKPNYDDFPVKRMTNGWMDTVRGGFTGGGADQKIYVVQTGTRIVERCVLMTTDPGDLVLDPTCGSGTSAYVAEQWGRRWITIDTSRVALALARARIMGARYPFYLLRDSEDGREIEAEITRTVPLSSSTFGDIRQGFVYERVPHITLRDIAHNAEIDVIWDEYQAKLEPLRTRLNQELNSGFEEWQIPRRVEGDWSETAKHCHAEWWKLRIDRQKKIDASIASKSEFEYLYDNAYEDRNKVRVAGPFTVESVTPHRMLSMDENGEFFDSLEDEGEEFGTVEDFAQRMLEHLKTSGVQQVHKEDKIDFDSVVGFPGKHICAEGQYMEGDESSGVRRRSGIYIGPEFGTVSRADLVDAAREAAEIGFDVLIALCVQL